MFLSTSGSAFPIFRLNSVVSLENNTADEAGSAVYEGEIDNCYLYTSGQKVIHSIYCISHHIPNPRPSFTCVTKLISSNPLEVHVCNHRNIAGIVVIVYPWNSPRYIYAHLAPLQETQET